MKRLLILFSLLFAFGFMALPAHASGDYGCSPAWKMIHPDMTGCNSSAAISPSNDTRVNLLLLMQDIRPVSAPNGPSHAEALFEWRSIRSNLFADENQNGSSYHSRCSSNEAGIAAFELALNAASSVSMTEGSALLAARRTLEPDCGSPSVGGDAARAAIGGSKAASAREFAQYLAGTVAFYDGQFGDAATQYGVLAKANNPWVRETALYMVGRVELNRAQESAFDNYGDFSGANAVDRGALTGALDGFNRYLKAYPKGQYAASARGLLRRVYWLGGNTAKLAAEYRAQMVQPTGGLTHGDLAEEIDLKLLPAMGDFTATNDPLMIAVIDLMRMRPYGGYDRKRITRAELEAQKPIFAANGELYDLLLASFSFHVENKPAEVLSLIPDAARQQRMSYLQFSRQTLRGLALEAMKDRNARGFWQQVITSTGLPYQRPAAELALAMNLERANALDTVFAANSPIRNATIRSILLQNVASSAHLRQQATSKSNTAHERNVALFTLLYKGLSRGSYAEFVKDIDLTPADAPIDGYYSDLIDPEQTIPVGLFKSANKKGDYNCPAVRESAAALAKNRLGIGSRICVAEFMRLNGFDQSILDTQPNADELGGSKTLFNGAPYSRLEVYKSIIGDLKAAANDKSYALYRAVHCYSPGGNNSCGGKDVPVGQRKAWHDQLKRDYPQSPWAKKLRYFW